MGLSIRNIFRKSNTTTVAPTTPAIGSVAKIETPFGTRYGWVKEVGQSPYPHSIETHALIADFGSMWQQWVAVSSAEIIQVNA